MTPKRTKTEGKMIYCTDCWCKDIGPKCRCLLANRAWPYFCGNCNHHVKGIEPKRIEPIIKLMKKCRIPIPEGMADYSWK